MTSTNFLFVGVGGQGVLTASDIVGEVGLKIGLDAKKSEIHGFSQRGGVVESHVRWGDWVGSPLGEMGTVDFLISFEMMEAARFVGFLKPDGVVITSTQKLAPTSVSSGSFVYPQKREIIAALSARTGSIVQIDALEIAAELGNARLSNTVVLGALSTYLDVEPTVWLDVIENRVPSKYAELNRKAFWQGQK
ncbi:MAG: indolepyruvate oxidoreductase subunit beta [Anaerolineales bacterium]|nr:indolepyruvate oxidoreductase subunit beta [Anaerolineales bacterium]